MQPSGIKVLVVDDHALIRKGVRAFLEEVEGIDVVGEASDGEEAVAKTEKLQPDVILMDLVMPHMDGVEAIARIVAQNDKVRVIALTSFATDDKVFPAIKSGAMGYILKDSEPDELVKAIHQVHLGNSTLDPSIARKVLEEISRPSKQPLTPYPLSEREEEVLRLVAKGLGNQDIADQLVITEITVRTHVSHILSKLHLANRVQATLYALREGMVSLDNGQG